jgi:uncharacterized membrane protein YgcG
MARALPHALILLLLASGGMLPAQERALGWRSIDVDARLDGDGRLHVRERQAMVFTGDWNGGERRFDVRHGQRLDFLRLLRVDSTSGAEQLLREGDLDTVHNYDWAGNNTLRWRSRDVSDPPFLNTQLTYILEYTYSNILVPQQDGGFVLDHDFAFPDRAGHIVEYRLKLAIDSVWGPPAGFSGEFGPFSLPPGEGYVVQVPLKYQGAGRPAGVFFGAPPIARQALAAILVAGLVLIAAALIRRERALGRFRPADVSTPIDEAWLKQHVFLVLPEVVGAAWDDSTSAPEVTAVLARLVSEGKLASEVKSGGFGWFRRDVLHLRLLVGRDRFQGHERTLIDALFDGSDTETDTDRVRQRYKTTGFDPASKIKATLEHHVAALKGAERTPGKPSRIPTVLLLVLAIALFIAAAIMRPADAVLAVIGLGASLLAFILAGPQAYVWQKRVERLELHSLRFIVPVLALAAALLWLLISGQFRAGVLVLAGLTVLCLAIANSVANIAKSRQGAEHIGRRRKLARARAYFRDQLMQPKPALRDEWFPYLIAFGLGSHMDKWFRAFGGQAASTRVSSVGSSSFGSSSPGSSWSGMGGGGGFAGGGSSGTWASAAGLMAAGVSAPSSSSSGGGGGGGGSSGGGGGGGW